MKTQLPMSIYVSGPFTKGDRTVNVRNAMIAGKELMAKGHFPFVPHLSFFFDLMFPHSWDHWMEFDLNFLDKCDALVRLPGESKGADIEVHHAQLQDIEVFYSTKEVPKCTGQKK
jgi:hypothetical protein